MKAKSLNKYLRTTALILASLFILFSLNKSFFFHTHLDENGKLVTHSHPYNKASDSSPLKEHGHSSKLLGFLLLLDEGPAIFQCYFTCIFLLAVCLSFSILDTPLVQNPALSLRNPRAPPISIFHPEILK